MSSTPLPTHTRQWHLTHKPTDLPVLSGSHPTFTLHTTPLPPLTANQLLLKTLYISNDPAQRGWISPLIVPNRLYVPPVPLNTPMRAYAVAQILSSTCTTTHPSLSVGRLVTAPTNWTEYSILDASAVQPLPEVPEVSPTHFLGALGMTGLTAYYGLTQIARAGPTDTVVISGAAGATGSMAVQIAKHMLGCRRVIGIAGGAEKCAWVVNKLGADACVDYKAGDFRRKLAEVTGGYVEVYFDNVGGEILDCMLGRMKREGRVAVCGSISSYNTEGSDPGVTLRNWFDVITMRLEVKGFIVLDYLHKAAEVTRLLVQAMREGKIAVGDDNETVVECAFEDVPRTWMGLFEGGNTGKLITRLW